MGVPLPPVELAERVGGWVADRGDYELYLQVGAYNRQLIESVLPNGWTWEGRRVLDFGCGAGRTLRHFLSEADRLELWGCDIDERSVRWLQNNLSPPVKPFVNGEAPPLPHPDGYFDVVYAISVFTHITDEWSSWLLELHRVLKHGGFLVATILADGMSQRVAGERWDESRVGMNVLAYGQGWDRGGPNVLLSPWWIRAHWGRLFDIVHLDPGHDEGQQGIVALRKRPVRLCRQELERPEPGEPREGTALRHQVAQLLRETATLRRHAESVEKALSEELSARWAAEQRLADVGRRLAVIERSKSWRLTKPLRHVRHRLAPRHL